MIANRWIFVLVYIALWSAQILLIKLSVRKSTDGVGKGRADYPFEVFAMTILVEAFKLFVALLIYSFTDHEWSEGAASKARTLIVNFTNSMPLIVAAVLYAAYNGLSFMCTKSMEPGTIKVLINLRVIFSGVLLHFVFGQKLRARQWAALVLLFLACVVEQSGSFRIDGGILSLALILSQGLCSSLGGIYFQWLLQRHHSMGIWLKNIYLYIWSITVYVFAVCAFRPDLLSPVSFFHDFDFKAAQIVVVAGLGGIFTSLLLRHLSVIAKEYASFAEMMVVAVAQNILFHTPLRPTLFIAICLVTVSVIMYNSTTSLGSHRKRIAWLATRFFTTSDTSYLPLSLK